MVFQTSEMDNIHSLFLEHMGLKDTWGGLFEFTAYLGFWTINCLTHSPYNENSRARYFEFLGLGERGTWAECVDLVNASEEIRNRLEWLLGPNAGVMYEIWKAKNL